MFNWFKNRKEENIPELIETVEEVDTVETVMPVMLKADDVNEVIKYQMDWCNREIARIEKLIAEAEEEGETTQAKNIRIYDLRRVMAMRQMVGFIRDDVRELVREAEG